MTEQRRLAAILVADVVGYSKIIGGDATSHAAQQRNTAEHYGDRGEVDVAATMMDRSRCGSAVSPRRDGWGRP